MKSLSELHKGQVGRIVSLEGNGDIVQHLMSIGLHKNDKVQVLERLLFGNNLVILSRDGKYVLRDKEARLIKVEILSEPAL